MSTLTKVFVVLLVLFSITFSVMTVSIVAQVPNWRSVADRYEEHARVADTNLRNLIAANSAELASARDAVRDHLAKIGELEGKLQAAQSDLSGVQSQLASATSEKASTEAINRGLVAQLQVAETARGEYRKQRDELERQSVDLQRRNIDLNDRVNELTAQIVVHTEQRRQFEQQIAILREENDKLLEQAKGGVSQSAFEAPPEGSMTNVVPLAPVAGRLIRGRVAEVTDDIVTLSVGSADGVQKGMVFVISRGDEYIGDVTISLVDPEQSGGRLTRSKSQPRAGDDVTDARGLAASRG